MKTRDKESFTFDQILLQPDYLDIIHSHREGIGLDDSMRQEINKASFVAEILTSHKKVKYPDDFKKQQSGRLIARIKADEKSMQISYIPLVLKIAAAALLLIALSVFFLRPDLFMITDRSGPDNELIVPSGEKSQLILADGTKVWINSESRLVYPANFNGRDRRVKLEGEAYFDVSNIKNSQFTVFTQDVRVKVLGTKFNIKSYPKDRTIETTVVEGLVRIEDDDEKVRFSPIMLKSAERMVFQKHFTGPDATGVKAGITDKTAKTEEIVPVREILISHVNTDNITCWKDHLLVFDNETLEEIAIKMSRWYKVQVEITDTDLKTHRYTGKFVNNESLDQVLEAINLTTPIQFSIDRNSVQIRSKTKKQQ